MIKINDDRPREETNQGDPQHRGVRVRKEEKDARKNCLEKLEKFGVLKKLASEMI